MQVANGTLFLEEINAMPHQLQTRLLRVLEDRQIRPVGDTKLIPVNVRSIAASSEIAEGKNALWRISRRSLLSACRYRYPDRNSAAPGAIEDVPLLVDSFLKKHAVQTRTDPQKVRGHAKIIFILRPEEL